MDRQSTMDRQSASTLGLVVLSKSEMLGRIRRDRHAVLLVNTKSRRGARHYDEVRALLQDRGFTITAEYAVADPASQLPKLLPEILAERPPLLVVGSGDGTVATVVDHLAYTDTVLGYLPLGTTNNFGRSLGLPLRLEPAVDVIAHGKVAEVDLGRVNEDVFANLVSLGISAVVAGRTPHALKRRLGRASYALTSMRALFSHRPFTAEVSSGGVTWRVRYLTGTEFTVSTDRPLQVDVDGEITTTTPLHVEVAAGALRVLVPETFPDNKRS
jgi:diacylglycerol kinase (ATP)